MAITHQKRLYAEGRLAGLTQRAAAIAAGCPERTASQAASRYEKDQDVIAHMARLSGKQGQDAPPAPVKESQPAAPATVIAGNDPDCPLAFMRAMMNCDAEDPRLRLDAAKALATYTIKKPGEQGKKEESASKAKQVADKYAAAPPPLKAVK